MDNPINRQIAFLIDNISNGFSKLEKTACRECNLTKGEGLILEALKDSTGKSVPQIAREFNTSRQNIQTNINDLSKKGLVINHSNPNHKTSPLFSLSQQGLTRAQVFLDKKEVHQDRFFSSLDLGQKTHLRNLLQNLFGK